MADLSVEGTAKITQPWFNQRAGYWKSGHSSFYIMGADSHCTAESHLCHPVLMVDEAQGAWRPWLPCHVVYTTCAMHGTPWQQFRGLWWQPDQLTSTEGLYQCHIYTPFPKTGKVAVKCPASSLGLCHSITDVETWIKPTTTNFTVTISHRQTDTTYTVYPTDTPTPSILCVSLTHGH